MNYLLDIKKKYRNFGIFKGIFIGCLVGALITAAAFLVGRLVYIKRGIIISIVLLLVFTLIWYLRWNGKYKELERKVNSLERQGNELANENFKLVGKNLSLGNDWLVYHNKLEYDFFTKEDIKKVIKLNGNHIEITDSNDERKMLHIDSSRDVDDIINNWLNASKEIDYRSNSDNIVDEEVDASVEGGMSNE